MTASDEDMIRRGDLLKLIQRAVDGYGQNMRDAADKKEKRDWQSMLFSAVDIRYAIKDIPAVQVTAYSENDVAALVEALESIDQYGSDTLSGPSRGPDDRAWQREGLVEMVKRARTALARVKGGA